ncbi:unnamed protein product [Paramecium octaurelia]|uniref:Tetratricopeptide repeat protein n=1 Tax=Paramecium octaurelia TaxID=43137 RepID=A0A8S1WXP1_PAROT|nr:unnamed protein product [Paramecium octaurelia]
MKSIIVIIKGSMIKHQIIIVMQYNLIPNTLQLTLTEGYFINKWAIQKMHQMIMIKQYQLIIKTLKPTQKEMNFLIQFSIFFRGLLYFLSNVIEKAFYDLNKVRELYHENVYVISNRILIYQQMGKIEKVCQDLNQAINLNPSPFFISYFQRAYQYILMGDFQKGLVDLNQVIQLQPKFSPSYFQRGFTYFQMDQTDTHSKILLKRYKFTLIELSNIIISEQLKLFTVTGVQISTQSTSNFKLVEDSDRLNSSRYIFFGLFFKQWEMRKRALNEFNQAIKT